ncbi:hypothetical protein [Paenibacillus segetis]|nr:hypothetical protein [Paenibacillus segetis]
MKDGEKSTNYAPRLVLRSLLQRDNLDSIETEKVIIPLQRRT